ncbi:cobalamin-independent methionine synthase II family protein [Peptostreptococcus faecalis]|uniref:cobalamin-independent methionine synthase II family protein n=1 Tax=Peptostreptococcus faecalis TaxID=2045015 RepID=UPI000C7B99FE|nr:cobalamin-independent methionine synthase II family protein [Peptostreptococcus faecalis]
MSKLKTKNFTTSLIGSWPRSKKVLRAFRDFRSGNIDKSELDSLVFEETKKVVDTQVEEGIDIITCGEIGRDNYVSFVSEKLNGVISLTMGDMLEYIEDKAAFEEILSILDVPSMSIRNAICAGKVTYKDGIALDEARMLKKLTDKPVKITLPGPYLLTRSMWLPNLSGKYYDSKEDLSKDVIEVLKKEIDNLVELGVEMVQFDEPVLTEVVFSAGKTRTFMCAALSDKKDPTEELEFAKNLLEQVFEYANEKNIFAGLHICRGNWSKDESILLSGSYNPLLGIFENINADALLLEFSTPRAGSVGVVLSDEAVNDKILGLGVLNPRTESVEGEDFVIEKAKEALNYTTPNKLWLNPDCGFATFANRPVSADEIIRKKLKVLNSSAASLRKEYGEY